LFALAAAASLVYSVVSASVGIRISEAAVDVAVPLRPGQEPSCCGGVDGEDRLHLLAGSYYTFKDGMASKLLLNNKGPRQLEVHPMLFSAGGEEMDLPPVTVEGQSFRIIDMGEWVSAAGPQFEDGSIQLLHRGRDLVLGAQVFVNDEARSLSFEEKLVEPVTFKSKRLEGLWWLPDTGGEVLLAVSNATGAQVPAVIDVHGEKPRRDTRTEITLDPHETRVFNVQRDLTANARGSFPRYGGITVTHSGANGAVLARGLARDVDAGYSLAVQFSEPAAAKSTKLQGAGMRLGRVGDNPLTPIFVARNIGEEDVTVAGRLPYTASDGSVSNIALPELRLAPGQMSVIDASQAVRAAGLPRATTFAGVEFEYTGAPGGVTVTALSYGRGGDQLFRVPLWDISAQRSSTGGYPWLIDGDSSTTVFVKNTSGRQLSYYLELNHPAGVYPVGIKTVEAGQTVTYDLRDLRDGQVPGAGGEVIPLDATRGQLHWSKVGAEEGVLIGRSEQADVARAVSNNYACMNCCNDVPTDADVTPESGEGAVGGSQNFVATQRLRDCYGYESSPTEVYNAQWTSSNEGVASVSVGMVTGHAPGTATIRARWTAQTNTYQYDTWDFDRWAGLGGTGSCQPDTMSLSATATYQVRPSVQVTSADIGEDRISIRLEPAGSTGHLRVTLVGANATHVLTERDQQGGDVTANFNLASLPNQDFTSIRATWTVNNLAGSGSLNYHILVLGDYLQTCYNVPSENDFTGGVANAGTVHIENNQCMWSSLSFRTRFLDEVNENGSGIDSVGTAIQIEGFCGGAPATSPAYNGRRYRRPADIRTSCNTRLQADHTVARGPGSTLTCDTPIFIDGIGRRFVEDRGGGLANDQIDNYKGVGAAACQGWANPRRKTVKLF
jgi:hypothetical protein